MLYAVKVQVFYSLISSTNIVLYIVHRPVLSAAVAVNSTNALFASSRSHTAVEEEEAEESVRSRAAGGDTGLGTDHHEAGRPAARQHVQGQHPGEDQGGTGSKVRPGGHHATWWTWVH